MPRLSNFLKQNGVKDDHIIVMIYDDIAESPDNPTPGVIINEPNGTNVYEGIQKDYTGDDLTPKNFYNILSGKEKKMKGIGTGKVIKSKAKDKIFVYYSDHGGPGILGMVDDEIHAEDLSKTLSKMSSNNKFGKLVFFVEACYAGSMFDSTIEEDENIFVMTASDPNESSYACYYDDKRDTYLADEFSSAWMHIVQSEFSSDASSMSLHRLYERTRTNTTESHVEEYGDLDIGSSKVRDFIGTGKGNTQNIKEPKMFSTMDKDSVPSLEVPLQMLVRKMKMTNDEDERIMFQSEIQHALKMREMVDDVINKILLEANNDDDENMRNILESDLVINKHNMGCNKEVIETFSKHCFKVSKNLYVRSAIRNLVKVCNADWMDLDRVMIAITDVCSGIENHEGIF